ncbi:hypothetical protein BH18THE2_BH18THE2_36620 [soil metagenome]
MIVANSHDDCRRYNTPAIRELLIELHNYYLKDNKYDEGDILFYRINYKLMDALGITKAAAEEFHKIYHDENPRRISEGYCSKCERIVTIIPIIYGVSKHELENLLIAEKNGKLIIGNSSDIKEGNTIAMFGCKICQSPLEKYGTM